MRNSLLLAAALLMGGTAVAQNYITAAPEGGFKVADGKDYIVLYAPASVISQMKGKIITNCNLDPDQRRNTLEYWVTDWDKSLLTLFNVPASAGEVNSFGDAEFINATPLFEWGTGVFVPRAQKYDLSKLTDEHHIHIGIRDFGSAPAKYKFAIGSQKTIKTNGFQIMVGKAVGGASGDYVGIGNKPGGNDGKWYYIDMPVKDLVDENGDFGFTYNFSSPITDGVFAFTFDTPTCSTYTTTDPGPGETMKGINVTKLGSALSIDHVFFYVPAPAGVEDIAVDQEEVVEAVYDLTGRRVENPGPGIYIVKTNLGTHKTVIR